MQSGSGKSSFFINHLLARWSDGPVYVKAKDEKEWEDKKVELLKADFDIEHIKSLPNNCLIFFDDFVKTCNDKKFQEIVNYNLRHECKTLILCIHDVFKSGLYNDLIQSSHFFITYCPGSLKLLQILDKQYKFNFRSKFQEHYAQGIIKHYIAFLNTDSQTFFPAFNILLEQTGSTEMFNFDESQVVFHSKNMACPNVAAVSNEEGLLETDSLPLHLYPKWEKRARYVLKIIKAMIDDQNCLKGNLIFFFFFKSQNKDFSFRHQNLGFGFSENGCEPKLSSSTDSSP